MLVFIFSLFFKSIFTLTFFLFFFSFSPYQSFSQTVLITVAFCSPCIFLNVARFQISVYHFFNLGWGIDQVLSSSLNPSLTLLVVTRMLLFKLVFSLSLSLSHTHTHTHTYTHVHTVSSVFFSLSLSLTLLHTHTQVTLSFSLSLSLSLSLSHSHSHKFCLSVVESSFIYFFMCITWCWITLFEMAAMPLPCNGNLLYLCEYTCSFLNVFQ